MPAGAEDFDFLVRDGESDFEVAAVIGGAYKGFDEGLEGEGVVVDDLTVESEGADGVGGGDVRLDVCGGIGGVLLVGYRLRAVAAVGFHLGLGYSEVWHQEMVWSAWSCDEKMSHVKSNIKVCDSLLLCLVLLPGCL